MLQLFTALLLETELKRWVEFLLVQHYRFNAVIEPASFRRKSHQVADYRYVNG